MKDWTSKFLPQRLNAWALRIALTFSVFCLVGSAFGGPYTDLDHRLNAKISASETQEVVRSANVHDEVIDGYIADLSDGKKDARRDAVKNLREYVGARAQAELLKTDRQAKEQIQEIKHSPFYRDERVESANWFEKAAENLWELLKNLFHLPKASTDLPVPSVAGLQGIIVAAWSILFALVAAFGYFAIRQARWKLNLKRKAKAILEEDEPERTLDEWLERADALEREGRHREAIRCLYLACLLRFDEARIARFDRGQTNWEHLYRIQSSGKLPPEIDFQPTTEAFDKVWYGMRTRGKPDVDQFRAWYLEVTDRLMKKAA